MKNITDSNGKVHKEYCDYLRSKHWNMMKHKAREAYGYKCSHCNTEGIVLHLHHKTYKRVGNENLSDLMFLCQECHTKEHKRLNAIKENRSKGREKAKATYNKNKATRQKKYKTKKAKKKKRPKKGSPGTFPIDYV